MYDQPQTGRRIGPALVALVVVLAAAGGTLGYFGARRIMGSGGSVAGGTPTATTPGPGATEPGPTTKSADPTSPDPSGSVADDPGTTCPEVTKQAVRDAGRTGDLQLVLYVDVKSPGQKDAEAWVCRDIDDQLYYQGHIKSGPLDKADNEANSILLGAGIKGTVERRGIEFVAINVVDGKQTEYHVSTAGLVLVNRPGRVVEYAAVRYVYP